MTVWMLTMGEFQEGVTHIEIFHTYECARVEAEKWIGQFFDGDEDDWEWNSEFSASSCDDRIEIAKMFVR